jgi:hypothetical protein
LLASLKPGIIAQASDMSFQDLGKSPLAPKIRPPSRSNNRNRDPPPPKEQPTPKSALDQISEALKHHQRDRNVLKEQSLISHSTTVPRYNSTTCLSAFSKLNDEIVQFQKMVNELQRIIECDVMTPEDQWRYVHRKENGKYFYVSILTVADPEFAYCCNLHKTQTPIWLSKLSIALGIRRILQ